MYALHAGDEATAAEAPDVDGLGTITCSSGFVLADTDIAASAECATEGGTFSLYGCCAAIANAAQDATYTCTSGDDFFFTIPADTDVVRSRPDPDPELAASGVSGE